MLFILFLHPLTEFWALTGQSRSIVLNAGADFALKYEDLRFRAVLRMSESQKKKKAEISRFSPALAVHSDASFITIDIILAS